MVSLILTTCKERDGGCGGGAGRTEALETRMPCNAELLKFLSYQSNFQSISQLDNINIESIIFYHTVNPLNLKPHFNTQVKWTLAKNESPS